MINPDENLEKLQKKENICLIGGLGLTRLYLDILEALENQFNIIPKKYHLITSPEKHREFKDREYHLDKVSNVVHERDYQSILRENYLEVYDLCRKLIKKEEKNYDIVCELTGGTKPVSVALTILSNEFNLPRIYYSGQTIITI